jgi:hypothetical protein
MRFALEAGECLLQTRRFLDDALQTAAEEER